jgi:protein-L-isoaspartate(D-aspartate) O-methyltransferase
MPDDVYAQPRREMVARQLRGRRIRDERVLAAMERIPRHRFMPDTLRHLAYRDRAVSIGQKQTISQPYMVALMTEMLQLKSADRVLEIGTGSGYQTAILAELAADVVSIERHAVLAERAREVLDALGYHNVTIIVGDGTQGHAARAPYDAILVTAGGPQVPPSLEQQLAVGGRLVCPVGPREVQELVRIVRTPDGIARETGIQCSFVPLIGEEGWDAGPQ